jgi:hypothetical protein
MKLETIQGWVAQGWCTSENENKEMDSVLALTIADIIFEKMNKVEAEVLFFKCELEGMRAANLQREMERKYPQYSELNFANLYNKYRHTIMELKK